MATAKELIEKQEAEEAAGTSEYRHNQYAAELHEGRGFVFVAGLYRGCGGIFVQLTDNPIDPLAARRLGKWLLELFPDDAPPTAP